MPPPVLPWEGQTLGEALVQSTAPWGRYEPAGANPEAVPPPVLPWEGQTLGEALA